MNRSPSPLALEIDFDAPEEVSTVYADAIPVDGDGELIDLIEEERCPLADPDHSDGLHIYLDGQNHCARCAMAAPWLRRDQCRAA